MANFYVCKTLLGGPDVNRRSIYRADDHSHVKTFNYEMKTWTPQMQSELDAELSSLHATGCGCGPQCQDEGGGCRYRIDGSK